MRERDIEIYLRDQVREAGGRAYKWVSPGQVGVPDRMVLWPGGRVVFVELKAPGRHPTLMQEAQMCRLRDLGFRVQVIDSKAAVDELVADATTGP